MLLTLIEKEMRNNLLNTRFLIAYFATTILMVGSVAVMLPDYLAQKKEYELNRSIYERQWRDTRDFHGSQTNNLVVRKPVLLGVFACGGERLPDNRALVQQNHSPFMRGPLKRSPVAGIFPPIDLVFIVGTVLSLLVMMLAFDAISGEREEGMLRLLAASPVPRDQLILAKWLGGYISIVLPLLVSMLLICLILVFTAQTSISADEWVRLGCMASVFLLYLAVVFSMTMMGSVIFRRSSAAALLLLLLWVVGTFLVPGLSMPTAHSLLGMTGVRTREVSMLAKSTFAKCDQRFIGEKREKAFAERFGGREWGQLSDEERKEWYAHTLDIGLAYEGACIDSIHGDERALGLQEARVEGMARWLARLSPFGCMQNACVALAGTGMGHELAVRRALMAHASRSWEHYRDWCKTLPEGDTPFPGYSAPLFQQPRELLGPALPGILIDIGSLALMGILFFLVTYALFVRMDVT